MLRELMQNAKLGLRPIGFIDDDPKLWNRTIGGLPVLGKSQDVPAILDDHLVTSILISSKAIEAESDERGGPGLQGSRGVSILVTGLELHPLEQECESLAQPNLSTLPAA